MIFSLGFDSGIESFTDFYRLTYLFFSLSFFSNQLDLYMYDSETVRYVRTLRLGRYGRANDMNDAI